MINSWYKHFVNEVQNLPSHLAFFEHLELFGTLNLTFGGYTKGTPPNKLLKFHILSLKL